MKVLLVAKTLTKGGAASGASNLLHALCAAGAEVVVMDAYAKQLGQPIDLLRKMERVCEHLVCDAETHFLRLGPSVFNLVHLYEKYHPDVIQLCDISGNVIKFSDISKVPCPVVHRMSDFWPYHGARHYSDVPPQKLDLAEHLLKSTIFSGHHLPDMRVAPSEWLANALKDDGICMIRNAVAWQANIKPRQRPRQPLRLGFIADPITLPRKGFLNLSRLLAEVSHRWGKIAIDLFGRITPSEIPDIPGVEVKVHGAFSRAQRSSVYAGFDILLCPSRLDNSPNVLTEALAYGVPVIAQSNTGMNSYVTPYFGALIDFYGEHSTAVTDLVLAIEYLTSNFAQASLAALDYVTQELCPEVIGEQYLDLYAKLVSASRQTSYLLKGD
ncbi:glycosyltransferase [Nodosilinea sp. E11]|uniref:glycosyltransferase n=1 Tax=Nodosilinea sp. E11 TaxID=3037479 RepID=UPI00293477D7|nr:glycosyltransferase [Nodosilinea sp. E11]WOD41090.1 glycosyltransferase [Nodosilinea sp. E11]